MINNIIKQLFPRIKSSITKTSHPHCGRDVCYCLYQLILSNDNDMKYYKECYLSWVQFNRKK